MNCFFLLSEKRIFCFLDSNGSRSPMAGVDNRFVGKDKQAAANMLDQCIEITSSQVGPSDASLEKYISREHAVLCCTIIYQASR